MQSIRNFAEDIQTDEVVTDSIEFILISFSKQVDENALSALEIPFATQTALLKVKKIVRLATVNPDGEELVDGLLERIDPDKEPSPSTLDSWARGAVLTKKVLIEEHSYRVPGAHSTTPSVSSFRSSATGRSKNSRGTAGSRSKYGSDKGHGGHANPLDKTGQIMELDDDPDGDFGNSLNSTGQMFDLLQKTKKSKAKGFVEKDAEKGEFDLMQEQLDEASRELKGKKFVLDRYGKPVVIGSIKAESLPPFSQPLGTNIKSTAPPPSAAGDDIGDKDDLAGEVFKSGSNAHNNKKVRKYIRVAGSRGGDESSFRPTTSLATTLSGVDHIGKVNAGVTVRSHAAVKAGERMSDGDGQHMSRQQYFSKTQSLRQSSHGDSSTIHSQLSKSMEGSPYQQQHQQHEMGIGERSMFSATTFDSQAVGPSRNVQGKHRNGGGSMSSTAKSIDHLPDIDAMEGARLVLPAGGSQDLSDEELGLGPMSTAGSIVRGKLPRKPGTAQKANIDMITGSPENGKPRDRDLPKNMRPVADRKHLPAPPLGQITGHGLSLEKYMEKSAIVAAAGESSAGDWHQQWRNA